MPDIVIDGEQRCLPIILAQGKLINVKTKSYREDKFWLHGENFHEDFALRRRQLKDNVIDIPTI